MQEGSLVRDTFTFAGDDPEKCMILWEKDAVGKPSHKPLALASSYESLQVKRDTRGIEVALCETSISMVCS